MVLWNDVIICASVPVACRLTSLRDTYSLDLYQDIEWSANNNMIVNSTKTEVVLNTDQRLDNKPDDRNLMVRS